MLDGSGSVTFDVLTWRNEQKVPLVKIDWTSNAVTVISGDSFAANRDLRPKPLGRAPALARWGERGGIERTAASFEAVPLLGRARLRGAPAKGAPIAAGRAGMYLVAVPNLTLTAIGLFEFHLMNPHGPQTQRQTGAGDRQHRGCRRRHSDGPCSRRSTRHRDRALVRRRREGGQRSQGRVRRRSCRILRGPWDRCGGPRHWFAAIPTFALRPLAPARST